MKHCEAPAYVNLKLQKYQSDMYMTMAKTGQ